MSHNPIPLDQQTFMYSVRNKNTQITHSKENLAKIGQTGIGLAVLRDIQPGNVNHYHSLALSLHLTAIFQVNLGQLVLIEAKDDGSGGDNWSYKSCKAPVKSSPPTN